MKETYLAVLGIIICLSCGYFGAAYTPFNILFGCAIGQVLFTPGIEKVLRKVLGSEK